MKKEVEKINVLKQSEIDRLKEIYPGCGVGPEVQRKLTEMIVAGQIHSRTELPEEYRFLMGRY